MSTVKLLSVGYAAIFLALVLQASSATANEQCTSSCGTIRNISYPFRVKGDPPSCGENYYELACENNNTILYLYSGKYYVQRLTYHNHTIKVVDTKLQQESCSFMLSHSLSAYNFSFWDPFYLVNSMDVIIFVRCRHPINLTYYLDFDPCGGTYTYALYRVGITPSDIQDSCTIIQIVPADSGYMHNRSASDIQNQLHFGFELSWNRSDCMKCYTKGQGCSVGIETHTFNCYPYLNIRIGMHFLFSWIREVSMILWAQQRGQVTAFIGVLFGGRILLGIIILLAVLTYKYRHRHLSMDATIEEFLQSQNNFGPIRYSYSEVKKMTKGFNDKLGQGGFGSVFKGKLRSGYYVAVKMLGNSKANGQDFINEVATIGMIHHVNVVKLIGFCAEGSKWALVYDFMPNGSLDKFVFLERENSLLLSWVKIYNIALGVARGIEYLHRGCDRQILHFDIKPHNILLDENFVPKISDFGLAKLHPVDNSIVSLTAARGTLGYIAPELFYKNIGAVSVKADVYSFGMLLMEMVGKRKNMSPFAEHSSQTNFPTWIYDRFHTGEDIEMGNATDDEKVFVRKMVIVALWCIQMKPVDRPPMSKVLEMLEGEVELLKMPPKPCLYPQMSTTDNNNPGEVPPSSCNAMDTITLDGR